MLLKNLFVKKNKEKENMETPSHPSTGVVESSDAPSLGPKDASPQAASLPEPVPAKHLEEAIIENIRQDNHETRTKVYQELLFSELLLALADPQTPGSEQAETTAESPSPDNQKQQFVNVAILSNAENTHFAAAFTSAAAVRRWRPEGGQYISMRGQDIFKILEPSPADVIVINPGSAPFIVLNKMDYRQLAAGVVPQNRTSPVMVGAAKEGAQAGGEQSSENASMQIAFPSDAFTSTQRDFILKALDEQQEVEAAALGAILPPGAPMDSGWLRTVFLRIGNVEQPSQEKMQELCLSLREMITKDNDLFTSIHFEVGVMPDPEFWRAVHENKQVLLDKNPPVSVGGA